MTLGKTKINCCFHFLLTQFHWQFGLFHRQRRNAIWNKVFTCKDNLRGGFQNETQYPLTLPGNGSRMSRNVVTLLGYTCRLMPTLWFSRRSVLLKALISGCWLFGNRCLKPAKDFRHQTEREVERHSPFLPQIQLLNSLSLESNTREKRKLHEENRFNCIVLGFAIHCFWAHHVDRHDVKKPECFYARCSCRLHGNIELGCKLFFSCFYWSSLHSLKAGWEARQGFYF